MSDTHKGIPIEELKPGMYIVALDRPWLSTPLFRHRGLVKDEKAIARLKRCGVRHIIIDPTKGRDVPTPAEADPVSQTARLVAGHNGAHVPPVTGTLHSTLKKSFKEDLALAEEVYLQAAAAVERLFSGFVTGVPLHCPAVRRVVTQILDRVLSNDGAIVTQVLLQQIRRSGENQFLHAVDTCVLSLVLGKECGLNFRELEELGTGALLHDVGQLCLPSSPHQNRSLAPEQKDHLLKSHPDLGASLLSSSRAFPDSCARIVLEHHERVNGSGYPNGLRGARISLLSQIVGLTDRYDAMTGGRDGEPHLPPGQAIRHLYRLGLAGEFQDALVERLIHCLGVYPVGSLVELSTGERGVVVAVNREERLKPSVKVIWDPKGALYPHPWCVDLSDTSPTNLRRSIRRLLDPAEERVDLASCFQD